MPPNKRKILYIERKAQGFFSIEKVFRQVARSLRRDQFESEFVQVSHGSGLLGIIKNLRTFAAGEADIYHITGDITYMALVLPPEQTVLTIHDLTILRYRSSLRRWILKKLLFDLPVRRSRYVTAISRSVAREIVDVTGSHTSKIRVIQNPVDDAFRAEKKAAFNRERPNILQIGALAYKNLPNVIRALEGLSCRLTVIGDLDGETLRLLEEKGIDYANESGLSDDAVREHYRMADIVTFCSAYEGFGLPIIEAQAMRTAVVTSDLEPMKSVAGDGALLVDPNDPRAIRSAIDRLITDDVTREALIEKGFRNVERFRADAVADEYAALYDEVIANREID